MSAKGLVLALVCSLASVPVADAKPRRPKTAAKKDDVDPKLVAMFNDAAAKAQAGKNDEALKTYRAILELQKKKKLAAIPRFIATTHLQASYSMIDLGKLPEAEKELKLVAVNTLGKPTQYDYHFTLGNVLGGQGKLKPMFSAFVEAISVAEDLNDLEVRPPQCWIKIIAFTMKAEDWTYLAEVSDKALQVARLRKYKDLETKALVAQSEAKKHLAK